MRLLDLEARRRVLTDFRTNLLVEAAAGTGKTSLMAGRVALMLAEGIGPEDIAAITFTEPAASELEQKIRWTIEELQSGRTPPELKDLLASPLTERQRRLLEQSAPRIDELTATTIHGFCQAIIKSYGLDAGLDPGARVVDGPFAEAMFDDVLSDWLHGRLAGEDDEDNPIAVLSKDDPLDVVEQIKELAVLRQRHLKARAPFPSIDERLDLEFAQAVDDFARWHADSPGDPWTAELIGDLQMLASFLTGSFGRRHSFSAALSPSRRE